MEIEKFLKNIDYQFSNESLLLEAITHPSLSKINKNKPNYQRFEFLGDKILSLIISEFLFIKYPNEKEGDLSRRHSILVSGDSLSKIALDINIDKILKISFGEENIGGRKNKRILENALEALIGAIYLDSNYQNAQKFVLRFWKNLLDNNLAPPKDPISQLQEMVQSNTKKLPQYEVSKTSGSDHLPIFTAKLKIPDLDIYIEAKGSSKKEAQKEVAILALKKINK